MTDKNEGPNHDIEKKTKMIIKISKYNKDYTVDYGLHKLFIKHFISIINTEKKYSK